ncbi:MAG: PAS domain S-box protein, partial [Thermodesulfobacteriota bacterium]
NIQEAYYEMDLAGNFTFVNDTICRHLGYSREELIGMNYRQYQDETTAEKMYQLYKKVYETGKPIEILDAELVRKDGTKGIYEMSVSLIRDSEGKPVGFRGVSREVTERKQMERALRQSEEKYRTILESIEDGYYEVDPAGNFTFFNDSMCRIFGYPKEELMGMNDRQYTDKENAKRLFQAFNEVYRTGEPHNGYGYEIIRKDGAKRYIEASILLQKDSSDKPIGFRGIIRDITDRRRAEEALRESEQRYRNLVENAPDVIFTLAPDGTITSLNPAFETITGWSGAEWLHKQFAPMLHPSDLSQGLELFQLFLKGEKIAPFQFKVLTKSGDYLVADFTVAPQIQNQSVIGILGIARDITERKKAEEALKKSEERFEELYDDAPIGYFEYNTDGRITSVNRTESEMLGYSVEEMIGQPPWKFIVEEDIARQQILDMLAGIMPPAQGLERTYRRKDGTTFPALVQDRLFQEAEGKILGIRATILDVTERKRAGESLRQSEEKYRTILESIEDGYYEVDLGGNFTFFNDSMCRILGYPKEELMGMNNQQYADKEVAKKVFQAFNRVYKTGKPGREFDWEIVRKDGTKRYIETSVSLRKDASGEPVGFRGIVRDITDRKRIEEQLFQAEKLRAVGEMASGVAHDFNNALAAILGNTQLLLYTAQDEELKETLKIIEQVAKDSGQTVRRLQDFTRRRVPQELFKVDINSIIKDSIEITKPRWKDEAQSRGIRIEIVSNLEDIPFASGNASELREVITNIIFNAIEAMHEGGKVEIRTFKKRGDIFIQISDTGVGIAEEAKKKIFEPFFTTKPFSNTGLGLSMSYGIVKRFGGEIEVESKVGQGTTFTITLPVGEEGKEEAVDPQTIKKGRKARILVIEDEEFVRSVLSRTLAQADHQVTLAEDGRRGVQLFKEGKFDIVLTDLGMPGVSGWEVCRMIKEISPHTPVGMITGWGGERSQSKMEEYGLDFIISKPFDFAQILNVVAETMESKEEG